MFQLLSRPAPHSLGVMKIWSQIICEVETANILRNFLQESYLDEAVKEVSSNLEEPLKNEALNSFLESVKTGNSIKDCIFKVQNEVLPKVPSERNKFFIKFTFDNQLEVISLSEEQRKDFIFISRLRSESTSSGTEPLNFITR